MTSDGPATGAGRGAPGPDSAAAGADAEHPRRREILWLLPNRDHDFPGPIAAAFRRARRVEQLNIVLTVLSVILVGSVMGSSQAMKGAWVEDLTSLVPPIAALFAMRYERRPADRMHPFGTYGMNVAAFAVAAGSIVLVGLLLLWDSTGKLIGAEHVAIETVTVLGRDVWLGYLMLAALFLTGVWPIVVSFVQRRVAREIFDRPIYADGIMNKAQWLSSSSAFVGVLLIGYGVWWGDALAGIIIALDITADGLQNLRRSISDIMDASPTLFEDGDRHPIVTRMTNEAREVKGVADCEVLAREHGRFVLAQVLVVPRADGLTPAVARAVRERIYSLNWRLIYVGVEVVDAELLGEVRARLEDETR